MHLEDRIRDAVREDRLPEPSLQFNGRVMAGLPDRPLGARWRIPAIPGLLRFTAIALVLVLAAGAIGLPLMLSKPGAVEPSQSADATGSSDATVSPGPSLAPTSHVSLASAGTFSLTGSMPAPRYRDTATRLLDGRVLIAGGCVFGPDPGGPDACVQSASAELYDPVTGTFRPTGSMTTVRADMTATLLPDGRVLIVGGTDAGTADLASAELYDPATGTFKATGSMNFPRYDQTATLLHDGRVLIAGGEGDTGPVASAELYDPAAGKFTMTGSFTTPRMSFTATMLPDGRVLIAGGASYDGGEALASAELFDPATGKFTLTGSMAVARFEHSATLLSNGLVLVAGGNGGSLGGAGAFFPVLASAELYDPSTGKFSQTGSMIASRSDPVATLLSDGRVLVAGGSSGQGQGEVLTTSAELYDPETGAFTATGSMTTTRGVPTATLLSDGRVLFAGGANDSTVNDGFLASAELYQP